MRFNTGVTAHHCLRHPVCAHQSSTARIVDGSVASQRGWTAHKVKLTERGLPDKPELALLVWLPLLDHQTLASSEQLHAPGGNAQEKRRG